MAFARRATPALIACALLSGLVVHFWHVLFVHQPGHPRHFADTWLMDGLLAAATGIVVLAAIRGRAPRLTVVLLATGMALFTAGFVYFHQFLPLMGIRFPTLSDGLWLAFYACVLVMFALKLRGRARGEPLLWLDAAANAFALVAFAWHVAVARTIAESGAHQSFAVGNLSYLVGDFVLAGMLLALVTASNFRVSRGTILLAGGLGVLAVADFGYSRVLSAGNYVIGEILDPLWVTAFLLVALSAWTDRDHEVDHVPTAHAHRAALVSPVFAVLAMATMLLAGASGVALALAMVSVVCVCLRLVLTLRANARLLEAVTDAQADYRQLVDTSQDLIWSIDGEGVVTFVNDASRRVLGRDPDEMIGRPFSEFIEPARRTCDLEAFGVVLSGETLTQYQTELMRPDGTARTLLFSAAPRRDSRGRVTGTTGTAADITAIAQAEAERVRLQQRATELERLEALGRLSGGIAHDFNNLIAIILSYAEFLGDAVEDEQAREDLEEIRRAAERASDLTRQLLVFARDDRGERELVDATAALDETVRLLRRTLGEDIELRVRMPTDACFVELGPGQFDQMLMNLALNARDAVTGGGYVAISLESISPRRVRLTVADDGAGMDAELQSRIFDPFFTTKQAGTGLGLATVYGIVAQAGGEIAVDSETGVGTRFRIELPTASPGRESAVGRETAARAPAGGEAATVLVVEDEPALREVIVRVLTRAGLQVIAARNGDEALERARLRDIDILLTDVVMPGRSGADTARAVNALQAWAVPVFMSGYNPEVLDDLGSEPLLRKPFSPAQLVRAVTRALAASRAPEHPLPYERIG